MADKKPKEKKAKKQKSALYDVAGGTLKRKNLFCPKCGSGIFMAAHKDRSTCGNCGFTQWTQKKDA